MRASNVHQRSKLEMLVPATTTEDAYRFGKRHHGQSQLRLLLRVGVPRDDLDALVHRERGAVRADPHEAVKRLPAVIVHRPLYVLVLAMLRTEAWAITRPVSRTKTRLFSASCDVP